MEIISERLSLLKKEDLLSIVILPSRNRRKMAMMFLWLFAWTVCGVIVGTSYFSLKERDAKLFVIVYLSFWAYFEVSIMRSFFWKRYGREKLWISGGHLHYQREVGGKGRIRSFHLDLVNPLKAIPVRPTSFFDSINQSFWIKGGERIELNVQGKSILLGMQLTDSETNTVVREVNASLKRISS